MLEFTLVTGRYLKAVLVGRLNYLDVEGRPYSSRARRDGPIHSELVLLLRPETPVHE